MTTDVKIQVIVQAIGIIASLITSIVAIIISIKTLKQNSKTLEESTRPYVTMYYDVIIFESDDINEYLILKNFGQTGTNITKFQCDSDLSLLSPFDGFLPFQNIKGTFLAPGQSLKCVINTKKNNTAVKPIKLHIEYCSGKKNYKEEIEISFNHRKGIGIVRYDKPKERDKMALCLFEEMIEKML